MKALPDMVARWLPRRTCRWHGRVRPERHPRGPARPVRDRPAAHRGGDPGVAGALRRAARRPRRPRPSRARASILRRPTRSPSDPASSGSPLVGSWPGSFTRLGLTSFGGPAAHVALLRDEFVARRGWLDDAAFLDLVGAANLIPGPTSTELAMHIGHRRAGWPGCSWPASRSSCRRSSSSPSSPGCTCAGTRAARSRPLLAGVGPVVIAIIVPPAWSIGRTASGPGIGPCSPWPRSWPASPACPRSRVLLGLGVVGRRLAGLGPRRERLRERRWPVGLAARPARRAGGAPWLASASS